MSKLNKQFEYLGIYENKYNRKLKDKNVNDLVTYMLNRSNAMFKYHNLPDTIPESELEKILQCNGFAVICKIENNLYAVNAGLGGETDVYKRPTQAVVSIPYLNYNATLTIDEDCIVIKSDTFAMGLLPMYYKYCTLINENEITMQMVNINQRVRDYLVATDDSSIESAEHFIDGLEKGELSVIGDESLFNSITVSRSGNSAQYVMKDLYEYEQYLKGSLFNEIGLSANYNMKRERLTQADIELNSDNLYPLVDDMLYNRKKAIEKINNLFNTNIEVEFNSSWDMRVLNGLSIHNTGTEADIKDVTIDSGDNKNDNSSTVEEIETNTEDTRNDIEEIENNTEDTRNDIEEIENNTEDTKNNIEDLVENLTDAIINEFINEIEEKEENED